MNLYQKACISLLILNALSYTLKAGDMPTPEKMLKRSFTNAISFSESLNAATKTNQTSCASSPYKAQRTLTKEEQIRAEVKAKSDAILLRIKIKKMSLSSKK